MPANHCAVHTSDYLAFSTSSNATNMMWPVGFTIGCNHVRQALHKPSNLVVSDVTSCMVAPI